MNPLDMSLQTALDTVAAEVRRATQKFPTWPTDPLHAVSILGEEFGELVKDVLQNSYEPGKSDQQRVRVEAIQTAAMAIRFLMSLRSYDYTPGEQHAQGTHGMQQGANPASMPSPVKAKVLHDTFVPPIQWCGALPSLPTPPASPSVLDAGGGPVGAIPSNARIAYKWVVMMVSANESAGEPISPPMYYTGTVRRSEFGYIAQRSLQVMQAARYDSAEDAMRAVSSLVPAPGYVWHAKELGFYSLENSHG
jgi:hypothetical protein